MVSGQCSGQCAGRGGLPGGLFTYTQWSAQWSGQGTSLHGRWLPVTAAPVSMSVDWIGK